MTGMDVPQNIRPQRPNSDWNWRASGWRFSAASLCLLKSLWKFLKQEN